MSALAHVTEDISPPTVHSDGRVTFRRSAPDADKVVLSLEGKKPIPMTKGEGKVWSVTTDDAKDYQTKSRKFTWLRSECRGSWIDRVADGRLRTLRDPKERKSP